jgi:hypothetical protein
MNIFPHEHGLTGKKDESMCTSKFSPGRCGTRQRHSPRDWTPTAGKAQPVAPGFATGGTGTARRSARTASLVTVGRIG